MTCDDGRCANCEQEIQARQGYRDLIISILLNAGRPCQRCIKRSIGHLCHDEPKGSHGAQQMTGGHNSLPAGLLTMQPLSQEGKGFTLCLKVISICLL